MPIKKKSVKIKQKLKTEIKQEPEKYKSVFLPIIIEKQKRFDANYYGIKQYLKNRIGLDFFKRIRDERTEKKKEHKFIFKIGNLYFYSVILENFSELYDYYQQMNLYILSLWFRYCHWWNKIINRSKK